MNAFSSSDGGVLLTGYFGDGHIDVDIHSNGPFSVIAESNTGEEVFTLENVDQSKILEAISVALGAVCRTSDLSIPGTTRSTRASSKAQRFEIRTMAVRQSSTSTVQRPEAPVFARTYRASMKPASPVTQQYSSSFPKTNSRTAG